MMKYVSTRGYEEELMGAQAIIQGIAPDKGLYVPKKIPELPFDLKDMVGKTYKEIAKPVIGAFFDDFTEEELTYCVGPRRSGCPCPPPPAAWSGSPWDWPARRQ